MQSSHAFSDLPIPLYTSHHNILPMNNGKKTLWPRNDETMYEVEILMDRPETEDLKLDKDIDEIINSDQYLCHICNFNVPKSYAKEHNNGKKHKICNELAKIALERTRGQILLETLAPRKIEVIDTYFCESCSVVVLNSNKETHDVTKLHAISVKHDELLEDLLKIYKNIENVEISSEIDEREFLKVRIEEESLHDVESLNSDVDNNVENEEYCEINFEEVKDNVVSIGKKIEEFVDINVGEDIKTKIDIEAITNMATQIVRDEFEKIMNKQLSEARLLAHELKKHVDDFKQKNIKVDEKIQECKSMKLGYEVKLAELKNQANIRLASADQPLAKKARNVSQTKLRMLKKLQIAKKKELFCNPSLSTKECKISDNKNKDIGKKYDTDNKLKATDEENKFETKVSLKGEFANDRNEHSIKGDTKDNRGNEYTVNMIKNKDIETKHNKDNKLTVTDDKNKNIVINENVCAKSNIREIERKVNTVTSVEDQILETQDPIDEILNRIESVMAKHFHKSCTVDALRKCAVDGKNNESKPKSSKRSKNINVKRNEDIKIVGTNSSAALKGETEVNNNNLDLNSNIKTVSDQNKNILGKEELDLKSANRIQGIHNKVTYDNKATVKKSEFKMIAANKIDEKLVQNPDKIKINEKPVLKTKTTDKELKTDMKKTNDEKFNQKLDKNKIFKKLDPKTKTVEKQEQKKQMEQKTEKNKGNDKNRDQIKRSEPKLKLENKKQDTACLIPKIKKKEAKTHAPAFSLVYYLKDLTRRCETKPIHTLEPLTDNIVQITAINGDKFKTLMNNFHSFHMKRNDIYCKVCESPNVRRPEWHIVENEHRVKIMIPIQDFNGIRQLDDIWSHCILCNDLTKNVDFHINSLHHKNKVKQSLIELGQNNASDDEKQMNVNTQKNGSKNTALSELVLKNNLAMTNKNYLNCIICDVIVNYDLSCVRQHINSFDHLNKFELKLLSNNIVSAIESDKYYCIPCDVHVRKTDVVAHCNGKKHGVTLEEYCVRIGQKSPEKQEEIIVLASISQNIKKLSKDKDTLDSELICFVCNTIIFSTEEHMGSFDHKKSYLTYLETNKLNEIEPDSFYCIPCNTVIAIDFLMTHCVSPKHKRILASFKSNIAHHLERKSPKEIHGQCKDGLAKDNKSNTSVTHSQGNINNPAMFCPTISNPSSMSNVAMSNKASDQVILTTSMSRSTSNASLSYSATSSPSMSNPTMSKTAMSNPTVSNTATSSPIVSNTATSSTMPLKVLYQFKELKTSKTLLCIICDEEVTYSRKVASYHISTLDHIVAFNLMMLWNKIKKCDNKYFCDICRSGITYFSEIDHILDKEHTDNLSRQPKGTVYEYDRTLLTHAYAMSHKVGDRVKLSPIVSVNERD